MNGDATPCYLAVTERVGRSATSYSTLHATPRRQRMLGRQLADVLTHFRHCVIGHRRHARSLRALGGANVDLLRSSGPSVCPSVPYGTSPLLCVSLFRSHFSPLYVSLCSSPLHAAGTSAQFRINSSIVKYVWCFISKPRGANKVYWRNLPQRLNNTDAFRMNY